MDTKRFELTPEEIKEHEYYVFNRWQYNIDDLLKAQVAKVLSYFQPVELEPLGDEERDKAWREGCNAGG